MIDELVEFLLRIIQSMVIAPPEPPRSGAELRATCAAGSGPRSGRSFTTRRECHARVMDDATALLEIEAIKQLKARYCRYLDTKDWQAWRSLFSDDFLSDTSQAGGKVIQAPTISSPSPARVCGRRPPCIRYTRRRSS